MKKIIDIGYTNKSFHDLDNNQFIQHKIKNGFNHLSNYSILDRFDFVPKLIIEKSDEIIWEYIKNNPLSCPTNDDLIIIANILKTIHNSNVKFTKFILRKRIEKYRKIMSEKLIKIDIINILYKKINLILKNMDHTTPVHGDVYLSNIIKSDAGKIYLVDWEYSHMGDKHFELAYFLESHNFTNEQEQIFLNAYKDYDEYLLKKHRVLVNYLNILWINAQDEKPYDDTKSIKRLTQLYKEGF